eukprot:CAMPEP_0119154026 /NCGR_PEP_ID=MMETSP1310-20130426/50194_1 /TAXON_ID=464262 /ORGANISM="Genus nov. species nov., Strain RCC2339" /LENGTH=836 /DNA_ID=CAMNT_0007146519 /DNA_START=40 /DNA_END=2547 /DNA_ORIENTATION=-
MWLRPEWRHTLVVVFLFVVVWLGGARGDGGGQGDWKVQTLGDWQVVPMVKVTSNDEKIYRAVKGEVDEDLDCDAPESHAISCDAALDRLEVFQKAYNQGRLGNSVDSEKFAQVQQFMAAFEASCLPLSPNVGTAELFYRLSVSGRQSVTASLTDLNSAMMLDPSNPYYRSIMHARLTELDRPRDLSLFVKRWLTIDLGKPIKYQNLLFLGLHDMLKRAVTAEQAGIALERVAPMAVWRRAVGHVRWLSRYGGEVDSNEDVALWLKIWSAVEPGKPLPHMYLWHFSFSHGDFPTAAYHQLAFNVSASHPRFAEGDWEATAADEVTNDGDLAPPETYKLAERAGEGDVRSDTIWKEAAQLLGSLLRLTPIVTTQTTFFGQESRLGKDLKASCGDQNGLYDSLYADLPSVHLARVTEYITRCLANSGAVDFVTSRGASLTVADKLGWTPLLRFAAAGAEGSVRSMLAALVAGGHSDEVNHADVTGSTALHVAVRRHAVGVVRALLEGGADLNVPNSAGRTARDYLCASEDLHGALAAAGEDVDCVTAAAPGDGKDDAPARPWPHGHGGWSKQFQDMTLADESCSIEERVDLSPEEFVRDYFLPGRPVMLRGALAADEHESSATWLRMQKLNVQYGLKDIEFPVGRVPRGARLPSVPIPDDPADGVDGARPGRVEMESMTVRKYIKAMASYVRKVEEGANPDPLGYLYAPVNGNPNFHNGYVTPRVLSELPAFNATVRERYFYIGAPDTGAPHHYHGAGWNELYYGIKEWVLLPPSHALYSIAPVTAGGRDLPPGLQSRALRCIQRSGDVLYIPELWSHATYNHAPAVGYAFELHTLGAS